MSVAIMKSAMPERSATSSTHSALGLSDDRLLQAAKVGHSLSFATLCERHAHRLLRIASRITRNHEDAEDAVQDALLRAFVHLTNFGGRSSFATWLTRITINSALMVLRKKRASAVVPIDRSSTTDDTASSLDFPDSNPSPEDICLQQEQKRILAAALNELTPGLRKAIELRELEELSTDEAARLMGLSLSAVKGRVFHGRGKLREMLKRDRNSAWTYGSSWNPLWIGLFFRNSQKERP